MRTRARAAFMPSLFGLAEMARRMDGYAKSVELYIKSVMLPCIFDAG
jgi:hypothetical protein